MIGVAERCATESGDRAAGALSDVRVAISEASESDLSAIDFAIVLKNADGLCRAGNDLDGVRLMCDWAESRGKALGELNWLGNVEVSGKLCPAEVSLSRHFPPTVANALCAIDQKAVLARSSNCLFVVQLLAAAHLRSGRMMDRITGALQERIANAVDDDSRARGYLCLAALDAAKSSSPLAGRQWIERAWVESKSAEMSRACVECLLTRLVEGNLAEEAGAVLTSVESSLDKSHELADRLRRRLQQLH